jgi:hypothetical protein
MALQINVPVTTDEGFEITNPFGYLNIYILNSNWANISYYKSYQDFISGKSQLNINTLPNQVQTNLTSQEFWGDNLAMLIHEKSVIEIEKVLGIGSVTIISE